MDSSLLIKLRNNTDKSNVIKSVNRLEQLRQSLIDDKATIRIIGNNVCLVQRQYTVNYTPQVQSCTSSTINSSFRNKCIGAILYNNPDFDINSLNNISLSDFIAICEENGVELSCNIRL